MKNELNTKRIQNTGGGIAAVNAALDDGFEFAYNPTQSGGVLTVVDVRSSATEPVGFLCNYIASSNDDVLLTVRQMVRLYTAHNIITIANSLDEFNEFLSKVA